MIAILRYAILKSVRDRSLPVFLAAPAVVITAALLGATLADGRFQYPLYINSAWTTPAQNAALAGLIATMFAVIFASMAGFWTFRPEIVTRAIGSFIMAARPMSVAAALVLFAAMAGIGAWICGIAAVAILTAAIPVSLAWFALKTVVLSFAAASLGALLVTISPQPAMIAWAYCGAAIALPVLIATKKNLLSLVVAVLVSMVCTAACAFFLERRCAT